VQAYERTTLSASASFSYDSNSATVLDVTSLIVNNLQIGNGSVVAVSGTTVRGVSAGSTVINVYAHSSVVGSVTVSVSTSFASIVAFDAISLVSISLSESGSSSYTKTATAVMAKQLTIEGQTAVIVAGILLDDGNMFTLTISDGLVVTSLNTSVITIDGSSRAVAAGSGTGRYVQVDWQPTCGGLSPILASTTAIIDSVLPQATGVSVTGVTSTLTAASSSNPLSASPALVATSSPIVVQLLYGGTALTRTTDPRTSYDVSESGGLFAVNWSTMQPVITPNTMGLTGTGYLIVRFTQTSLIANVSITIVSFQSLTLYANPLPSYSGSTSKLVTTLSVIANTGIYQQAQLYMKVTASNGATFDVSGSSLSSYAIVSGSSNLALSSRVISVPVGVSAGTALLQGTYSVASSQNLTITVSSTPVLVSSFMSMSFLSTLSGIQNVASSYITIGATFSDGTQYTTLFSNGVAVLPGLVTFSGNKPLVATVNPTSGLVVLNNNYYQAVTLTATSIPNGVTATTTFFANLLPDVGDVDLGAASGAPISSVSVNAAVSIPVVVNTGTTKLGSVDLTVMYDPTELSVQSVVTGSSWPGGTFVSTLNSPPGTILLGGSPSTASASTTYMLATITFKALKSGLFRLNGTVNTLASPSTGSSTTNIGSVFPREFVAGTMLFDTLSYRRRSLDVVIAEHARSRRSGYATTACSSPPCSVCSTGLRQTGDTNGDCVFDVKDVSYLQTYLTEQALGFSTANGMAISSSILAVQVSALDVDGNGAVDPIDTSVLARINFQQLRFLTSFAVTSVSVGSGCMMTIQAILLGKGNVADTTGSTYLAFDIGATAAQDSASGFSSAVSGSQFINGSDLHVSKGTGLYGSIWKAADFGNGLYEVSVYTALSLTSIGISPIQTTVDGLGVSSTARSYAFFSSGAAVYTGSLSASYSIGTNTVSIIQSSGYSPYALVDNVYSSAKCFNFFAPAYQPSSTYTTSVSESAPLNSVVANITATDGDLNYVAHGFSVDALSSTLVYSISGGNSEGKFAIGSSSGQITLVGALNYSMTPTYTLSVLVHDSGALVMRNASGTVQINVMPATTTTSTPTMTTTAISTTTTTTTTTTTIIPFFNASSFASVVFESASVGAFVTNVQIADFSLISVQYSISLTSDVTALIPFSIDVNSGDVTVSSPLSLNSGSPFYNLTITATSLSSTATCALFVHVLIAPVFTSGLVFYADPSTAIGSVIATVSASQFDGAVVTYALTSASLPYFSLDAASGQLLLNSSLSLVATGTTINLGIVAIGEAMLQSTQTVFVVIESHEPLSFIIDDGTGFLKSDLSFPDSNSFTQTAAFFHAIDQQGFVSASHSTLHANAQYTVGRSSAMTITGIVTQSDVYSDQPTISVVAQVFDAAFNVKNLGASVQLRVVPDVGLAAVDPTVFVGSCLVTSGSLDGTCTVTSPPLSGLWFNSTQVLALASDPSITLYIGFAGQDVGSFVHAGTAIIRRQAPFADVQNNVRIDLPSSTVYRGSMLSATLTAQAGYQTETFLIELNASDSLSISSVSAIDSTKWSITTASLTNSDWVILGRLVDSSTASSQPVTSAEAVLRITFTVNQTAAVNQYANLTCRVAQLTNVKGESLYPSGTLGEFIDRTTTSQTSTVGHVYVSADSASGILPYVSQSELVNTAVLSGTIITSSLQTLAVYQSGVTNVLASGMSCTSANSSIVKVYSNCSAVYLDGSEASGAASVLIHVAYGSVSASVALRVWMPNLPVSLQVSDAVLNAVTNWLDPATCQQQYQRADISALTSFQAGLMATPSLLVTDFVASFLVSSNTTVVTIDVANRRAVGVMPGTSMVRAVRAGLVLGQTAVSVSSVFVNITKILTTVATDMSVSLTGAVSYNSAATASAHATVSQSFTLDGISGYTTLFALFTDSTSYSLLNEPNVALSSLSSAIVSASGNVVQSVSNGAGFLVQSTWSVPHCTAVPIATGFGFVSVSIPQPTSVIVTTTASRITFASDSAVYAGVPSYATLNVKLQYGQVLRDYTNDSRTIYDLSQSKGLLTLSTQLDGSRRIVANGTTPGTGVVTVRFTHVNSTQSLTITVLSAVQAVLLANPYPTYTGSNGVNVTSLHPLTNQFIQTARLRLYVVLSDSEWIDVTTSTRSSYLMTSGKAALSNRIVSFAPGLTSGNGVFSAQFGTILSNQLTITINSSYVNISSFFGTSFPSTLGGIAKQGSAYMTMSGLFSDGTQYPNLFVSGVPAVPGLVVFSGSDPAVFTVSSTTGQATIQNNSYVYETITATATNGVSASASFACNLDPAVGDVDLGNTAGLPLSPASVGSIVSVPVRVNIGSLSSLGSIDLNLYYDASKLTVVSAVAGADWPAGAQFLSTLNSPPGQVSFGGALPGSGIQGLVTIAVVSFTVLPAAAGKAVGISGVITTMANPSGQLLASSGAVFVAGNVVLPVLSSRREVLQKHDMDVVAAPISFIESGRERRGVCSSPPCSDASCVTLTGKSREMGDADGNCVFDIRDVQFTQSYIVAAATGFATAAGMAIQSKLLSGGVQIAQMDVDHNSVVDGRDSVYLAKVNFRQLRFMTSVAVQNTSASGSSCTLTISVLLTQKGGVPVTSQTFVYFDIGGQSAAVSTDFGAGSFKNGSLATYIDQLTTTAQSKGSQLYGGFWQAVLLNPLTGQYGVVIATGLQEANLGISILQVTVDSYGATNVARTFFLDGSPSGPFVYSSPLNVNVGALGANIVRSAGYNPFLAFSNLVRSDVCQFFAKPKTITATIVENSAPAASVAQIVIFDPAFPAPNVAPAFQQTGLSSQFAVGNSGIISSLISFDYEVAPSYTFAITVSIAALNLNATVAVVVNITDEPVNPPAFGPSFRYRLLPTLPIGFEFARYPQATSVDVVTYSLSSSDSTSPFAINVTSGAISVAGALPANGGLYTLHVIATDAHENLQTNTSFIVEVYNSQYLVQMDLQLNAVVAQQMLDFLAGPLQDEVGLAVLIVSVSEVAAPTVRRSATNITRVVFGALPSAYQVISNQSSLAAMISNRSLLSTYGPIATAILPFCDPVYLSQKYGCSVLSIGSLAFASTPTASRGSSVPTWEIVVPVILFVLVAFVIFSVVYRRRLQNQGADDTVKAQQLLNARKNTQASFELPIVDAPIVTASGGHVDKEGNAFFYKTKEEIKTVNTTVLSPKLTSDGQQVELFSTMTKVVTDEKHWLRKQEPDVMEEKTFDDDSELWPSTYQEHNSTRDPQEFLLGYPTMSDRTRISKPLSSIVSGHTSTVLPPVTEPHELNDDFPTLSNPNIPHHHSFDAPAISRPINQLSIDDVFDSLVEHKVELSAKHHPQHPIILQKKPIQKKATGSFPFHDLGIEKDLRAEIMLYLSSRT